MRLPEVGSVYLDAQILIYSVEKHPQYWPLLRPLWVAVQAGRLSVVTSELSLLETLVGPLKMGLLELAADYERLLLSTEVRMVPISRPLLKRAAQLRAESRLKTPDAIHAASAIEASCDWFITNDSDFKGTETVPLIRLRDIEEY